MNYSEYCRLCLVKSKKNQEELFFPIDKGLERKFNEITNLKLVKATSEELKLPESVCMTCTNELEHHVNYRNGLIEKQMRLNSLLGCSFEETKFNTKDEKGIQTESINGDNEVSREETSIEHEQQEFQLHFEEAAMKETEINIKTEHTDQESIYDETFYDPEPDETEPDEYIITDEEQEDRISETEEGELEDDVDVETTIDQLEEEDYQIDPESEGFQMCAVTPSGDEFVETDDGYDIVYEKDIAMEEEPPHVKRKYVKQSRDTPKKYKCWIKNCHASFAFRAPMTIHLKQVHGIKGDSSWCFMCGKSFENKADFLAHVKTHTRMSECDICQLKFVSEETLLIHKSKAHKKNDDHERTFHCDKCIAKFKRKEHLNSHKIYKHSDKSARKHGCKNCTSTFLTRQDLKNHEKSHTQVKIDCIYCSYNCRDLKSIRRHAVKLHNTKDIYKCPCDETFELHRDLQSHKKTCSGANPEEVPSEY